MKHLSISWPSNNSETPPHFFEICLLPPTINWTKVRTDETCFWWNFLSGKVFSQRVIFGFFHSQGKKRRFFGCSGWCFFFFRSKFCPVTPFYWELRTCDPMKSNELSSSGEGSCLLLINSGPFSGLSWWSFESWDQKQRSQLFYICISQHLQVGVSILRHPKGCWIDTPCKAPLSLKVCISTCLFKTRQVLWIVDLGRSVKRWAWSEKRFLAGMEGSFGLKVSEGWRRWILSCKEFFKVWSSHFKWREMIWNWRWTRCLSTIFSREFLEATHSDSISSSDGLCFWCVEAKYGEGKDNGFSFCDQLMRFQEGLGFITFWNFLWLTSKIQWLFDA